MSPLRHPGADLATCLYPGCFGTGSSGLGSAHPGLVGRKRVFQRTARVQRIPIFTISSPREFPDSAATTADP